MSGASSESTVALIRPAGVSAMTTVMSPSGSRTSTSDGRRSRSRFAVYDDVARTYAEGEARGPVLLREAGRRIARKRQNRAGDPDFRAFAGQRRRHDVDWQIADELGDKAIDRVVRQLVQGARLLQPSTVHDRDAVGNRRRFLLVMGDVERGGTEALVQPPQLGAKLDPQIGFQMAERLVHQENARRADDGASEPHPLPLSAAQEARLLA